MDNKLIFLLLFGLASVSSSLLPNGCPADFSVHILLPHESDCGLYYVCSNGYKHLFQCPGATLFDFELQGCDWAQNVNCQETATAPEITDSVESTSDSAETDGLDEEYLPNGCPVDMHINLLLAHEYDCTKFYQCAHGNKVLFQCPAQLHFDVELQVCNWAHLVDCPLTTTTRSIPTTTEATSTSEAVTEVTTVVTDEVTDETTTEYYTTTVSEILTSQPVHTTEIQSTIDPITEPAVTDSPSTSESLITTTEATNSAEPVTDEPITSTTEIVSTIKTTESPTTTTESEIVHTTIEPTEYTTSPEPTTKSQTTEFETTTEYYKTTSESASEKTTTESGITATTEPDSTTNYETTTQDSKTTTEQVLENLTTTEVATETTEPESQICPEGYFGSVPHPYICNAYYLCTWWAPILLTCPRNMEFDPETRDCVPITEGGCTWYQTSSTTTTQASWETTTADISTTEASGSTDESNVSTVPVEATTGFDSTTLETTWTSANYTEGITEEGPNITTEGVTEDLTVTTEAWSTNDYLSTEYTTASNNESTVDFTTVRTTIDTSNNTTSVLPEITTTQEVTTELYETTQGTEPTPPICPDGFFGNVPHPERCDAYYLCSGWSPILLYCPNGFGFDPVVGNCVQQAEGGCNWLQTTTSTATESAATDPTTEPTFTTESPTTFTEEATTLEQTTQSIDHSTQPNFTTESPATHTEEATTLEQTTQSIDPSTDPNFTTESPTTHTEEATTLESTTQNTTAEEETEAVSDKTDHVTTDSPVTESTITTDLTTQGITVPATSPSTHNAEDTTNTTEDLTVTPPSSEPSTVSVATTQEPETTAPLCPDGFSGLVADATDCTAYFMCSGWMPISMRCPNGFEFDSSAQACVVKAEGGCTWQSTSTVQPTETTEEESEEVILPGVPGVPDIGIEIPEPTTDAPDICPPGYFGMVANPSDCTAYYLCSLWEPIPMLCPTGFEFSLIEQRCVQSTESGCKGLRNENVYNVDTYKSEKAQYGDTGVNIIENEMEVLKEEHEENNEVDSCPQGFKGILCHIRFYMK